MINLQEPRFDPRHEGAQRRFLATSGCSRKSSPSTISRSNAKKYGPIAAEEQLVKIAAVIRIEADDLAIQDDVVRADAVRDLLGEQREVPEGVPAPRDQSGRWTSRCASARKPSCFSSNSQSMVDRLRQADERHRAIQRQYFSVSQFNGGRRRQ